MADLITDEVIALLDEMEGNKHGKNELVDRMRTLCDKIAGHPDLFTAMPAGLLDRVRTGCDKLATATAKEKLAVLNHSILVQRSAIRRAVNRFGGQFPKNPNDHPEGN